MKTIALVTQKGGAGKTTLAASLAVAAQDAGETVAILDLDPQGSLAMWAERREAEHPACDVVDEGKAHRLPDFLPQLEAQGFTLTILDTAGIDGTATHAAMAASDMCLIPTRPTAIDIRAVKATFEAAVRLKKDFAFILNNCPTQPNNPRAHEAATALKLWGVLALPLIVQRVAYGDAFAESLGVTEYESEGKAAEEMRSLWSWINSKMKGEKHGKKTLIG
ncbi:AAA family ATPase [Pseudosulfitobacter sp. DSM 107133]|uniref:nucleotide-binding protein n=1 Tax=Pseudosulfitobacter sp. DSM 107133 TaxID=2883100 RepID=UPI000DF2F597|nr:AAA family ATPase [Pseudosulfitobacter sp. DSM 107133]UOA30234.1 Protein virC1 [Pseudosulfitobacter sp. DSM 107133]